jgi:hypothetical protein
MRTIRPAFSPFLVDVLESELFLSRPNVSLIVLQAPIKPRGVCEKSRSRTVALSNLGCKLTSATPKLTRAGGQIRRPATKSNSSQPHEGES